MNRPSPVVQRRALGYRLLGPRFDYLLHTRPAEWPIMAAHTAVGLLIAVGPGAAAGAPLPPGPAPRWALGLLVWVLCLNGGTLALNSAVDRDTEDVAYLRSPPEPPPHLFAFGMGLMLLGLGLSFALPVPFRLAYLGCFIMSVLYSAPPARLKSVAGADWFINIWGFGTLTPYAGWALSGRPVTPAGAAVLLGFGPLFAALYPLTQLYQLEHDRARGDRTLASALGPQGSLAVAVVATGLAFGLFTLAGVEAGWRSPDGPWRWLALLAAAAAWLVVLLPWLARVEDLSPRQQQVRMYHALLAWAVTDAAILYGFAR